MTEPGGATCSVLVWVSERTWQACIDAARRLPAASTRIALIHVTEDNPPNAAHGAYLGLMGRRPPSPDPAARITEFERHSAAELLDAAARRLGRPCDRIGRHGHPEREVVTAAADADLLIVARDGDPSRLGPKSLGKEARFVVDHAPCPVLLIWPGATPSVASIPPQPPKPPHTELVGRPGSFRVGYAESGTAGRHSTRHDALVGHDSLKSSLSAFAGNKRIPQDLIADLSRAGTVFMPAEGLHGRAVGVDRLQPGDHAFLGYADDDTLWEILSVYTQQGLARDEKVGLVVDVDRSTNWVAARVAGGAGAAAKAMRSGQLVVSNAPRFARGGFDAGRLVEGVRRRIDTASAEGFSGLRSASETSLALAPVDHLGQAVEYETALHASLFAGDGKPRFTALCMWDERLFGAADAMDAARAVHPVIVLPRLGTLHASVCGNRVSVTGDSDLANQTAFDAALRTLGALPATTLILEITDLSFFDAHSAGAVLRFAAGLTAPRQLEVRCRSSQRRLLYLLGGRSIRQLSIITMRL